MPAVAFAGRLEFQPGRAFQSRLGHLRVGLSTGKDVGVRIAADKVVPIDRTIRPVGNGFSRENQRLKRLGHFLGLFDRAHVAVLALNPLLGKNPCLPLVVRGLDMKPVHRLNDRVTTGAQFGAAEEVLLLPGMGTVLGDIAVIAVLDHSLLDRERGVGRLFPGSRSARQGRDLVADVAGHPGLGFGRQLPVGRGRNQSRQHPGRRVTT